MNVTKIEAAEKTKYKVYIDGQFVFALYKGELSRYQLKEAREVSAELYQEIKDKVIIKRAKLRAMHLLDGMSRTESQLRIKLKQNDYTDDVIDAAIDYVKGFGYINDENYVRSYILNKQSLKSKREIHAALVNKGIASKVIDQLMEEYHEGQGEQKAIKAIAEKKRYNPETASPQEKQKMYAYLARKGFRYDDIRQVLQVSEWKEENI